MKDKPRIGCVNTYDRIQIFNGNYSATGEYLGQFRHSWCVYTPTNTRLFDSHTEALEWALQEAREWAALQEAGKS